MKRARQEFSGLKHLRTGNDVVGLMANFAMAEVRAYLANSLDGKNNALRAANVSLALAMEKYAYYHLLDQNPGMRRQPVKTESVDNGFSSSGEKLLDISVVRIGFFSLDEKSELTQRILTNFVCDHTGILVALPKSTKEDYSLGRFRAPVSVQHAFDEYSMRIGCPGLSFEGFEDLQVSAAKKLVAEQPTFSKVS